MKFIRRPIPNPRRWWKTLDPMSRRILWILAVVAVLFSVPAALLSGDWSGLFLNLGTELAGGAVTFVLLDQVLGTSRRKADLIAQLGSTVNDVAIAAASLRRIISSSAARCAVVRSTLTRVMPSRPFMMVSLL